MNFSWPLHRLFISIFHWISPFEGPGLLPSSDKGPQLPAKQKNLKTNICSLITSARAKSRKSPATGDVLLAAHRKVKVDGQLKFYFFLKIWRRIKGRASVETERADKEKRKFYRSKRSLVVSFSAAWLCVGKVFCSTATDSAGVIDGRTFMLLPDRASH